MSQYRLKISEHDFSELQRLVFADLPKEAGAFALAGINQRKDGVDVIVRRPLAVSPDDFRLQHEARLEIAPRAINGLVALCQSNQLGAVICHSHPADIPYSPSDDQGERRIADTLRQFIPKEAPIASLLLFPEGVRGRIWRGDSQYPIPFTEILVIGRRIRRILDKPQTRRSDPVHDEIFDRQVRAFGKEGQQLIEDAKVAIVGIGGTGSPTAEQLVRMGVEDLILIDPDYFESSNVTRMYGTFFGGFGVLRWVWRFWKRKKVDLMKAHLKRINPKLRVQTIAKSVVVEEAARALLDRDVIFLCTDDHWGRSIVNQIAYQYLIPVINVGMRIAQKDGIIQSASGVVDILQPDLPCLWCKQTLDADRIAAESMPPKDRQRLEREGYIEGIEDSAPTVVSITTVLSGLAVSAFLQLVTDFMGRSGDVARLNYNVLEGTVRRGTTMISDGCICRKVRGVGDGKPRPTVSRF